MDYCGPLRDLVTRPLVTGAQDGPAEAAQNMFSYDLMVRRLSESGCALLAVGGSISCARVVTYCR